jgi:transcriptional regulator with XRE-family HTH domain
VAAQETHNHRTDIGRRVALRREQLGLSREDVAERAGVAPQYLRYLEEKPASPSMASLIRVARALDTSVAELSGAEVAVGVPPGGTDGKVVELDPDDCYQLVADHNVGRISVSTRDGPAIVPVNYALIDGAIVFRTAPGAAPSFAPEAPETAFEVDHLDEAQGIGWSVLIVGPVRRITGEDEIRRLTERAGNAPWAPGKRELWVRLSPGRVTGRRIYLA